MNAITIHNLSKVYPNNNKALDNVSLEIKQGEIFGLLGTNGAGKSTLIHILTSYIEATKGNVIILEKNVNDNNLYIRSQIACVAQNVSIDDHLSLYENMIFQGRLYGIDKKTCQKRIQELISIFSLEKYTSQKVVTYSGGIKRRLDIAMSLISSPKILFLDEPTVGMDIQSRKTMWEMLLQIKMTLNTTIVLTTHYLEEADYLSDTICFLKDGKVIMQDSPENLKKYTKNSRIKISTNKNDISIIQKILANNSDIKNITIVGTSILVEVTNCEKCLKKINKQLLESESSFTGIEIITPTLDDIFIELMQDKEEN
ncbi:MAG: ABC transporter ATP-binding protein [Coprobacillaceae bacterium]